MTRVKICGITNIEDALAAVHFGADMLGFVFASSPRRLDPEEAAGITVAIPAEITKIGVFVDEEIETVRKIALICHLDFAQLHGSESREYAENLGIPHIKAFRVRGENVLEQISDFAADTFLLDSFDPSKAGGTGKTLDWNIAAKASVLGRMILAGGLTPENVTQAIAAAKPYAVDVSSGVEISPGRKDHDKLRQFISGAKSCERR